MQIKFVTKSGSNTCGTAPRTSNCVVTPSTPTPGSATAICRVIRHRQGPQGQAAQLPFRAFRRVGQSSRTRRSSSSIMRNREHRARARCSASCCRLDAVGWCLQSTTPGAGVQRREPAAASRQPTVSSRRSIRPWAKVLARPFRRRPRKGPAAWTALSNPLVQQDSFSTPTQELQSGAHGAGHAPVLAACHRRTGPMNYRHINSTPDTTNNAQVPFPGMADERAASSPRDGPRPKPLRSTFGASLVQRAACRRHRRRDAALAGARALVMFFGTCAATG